MVTMGFDLVFSQFFPWIFPHLPCLHLSISHLLPPNQALFAVCGLLLGANADPSLRGFLEVHWVRFDPLGISVTWLKQGP